MLLLLLVEARRLRVWMHPRRGCRRGVLDSDSRSSRADVRRTLRMCSRGRLQQSMRSGARKGLLLLQHLLLKLELSLLLALRSRLLCELRLLLAMLSLGSSAHLPLDLFKRVHTFVEVGSEV